MMLRRAALAIAGVFLVVACGDPDLQPASDAPAATGDVQITEASASTTPTSPAPTEAQVEAIVPTTITVDTGSGEADLDWVAASDPFPAQADAAADPTVATIAITWAYRHWILLDLDPEVRARIIENGEANTDRIEATMQQVEGTIRDAGFEVDAVELTGVDSAQVRFRITWQGGPSPIFPDPMVGTAVFRDDSWRVGGRTLCLLTIGIGQECSAEKRLAPEAYRVTGVPAGVDREPEYDDTGLEVVVPFDVVRVPGRATWWPEGSPPDFAEAGPSLSIETLVLPDVATLTADDLAVVARARWGSDGGSIVEVAGGRGLTEARAGFARVLVVRPDDVVVNVTSSTLTIDELAAIVLGLEPTD